MKMSAPVKILSDGKKIAFINGQSFVLENAIVERFDVLIRMDRIPVTRFGDNFEEYIAGPQNLTVNLTLTGCKMEISEGANVFDEGKIKEYAKQINTEVKKSLLKRSLEF